MEKELASRWYVRNGVVLKVANTIHPGEKAMYSVYHNDEFVAIFYEATWPEGPSFPSLQRAQEEILKELVLNRGWVASQLAVLDQRIFKLQEELGVTK